MKITLRSKKSNVILLSVVLLLSGLAYGYYTMRVNDRADESVNYNPATEEEKQAGEELKKQIVESPADKPIGSDPLPPPAEQQDGSKPIVGVNVVNAMRNGDSYRVQTFIQAVTNTGKCTLVVTDSSGKVYRATSDVQALPSSSTCKGFTIPVSELSAGVWKINLQFENESVRGSAEKEMQVS